MANIAVITRNAVEIIAAIILIRTFSDFKNGVLLSPTSLSGDIRSDLSWLQFVLTFAAMIYMVFNKFSAVVRTDVINI